MVEQVTPPPSTDPRLRAACEAAAILCMAQSIASPDRWAALILEHVAPVLAAVEAERDAWKRLAEASETVAVLHASRQLRYSDSDEDVPAELWERVLAAETDRRAAKAAVAALAGGGENANERTES
jgi:hypothetical protein